jgi:hypothetical protein
MPESAQVKGDDPGKMQRRGKQIRTQKPKNRGDPKHRKNGPTTQVVENKMHT